MVKFKSLAYVGSPSDAKARLRTSAPHNLEAELANVISDAMGNGSECSTQSRGEGSDDISDSMGNGSECSAQCKGSKCECELAHPMFSRRRSFRGSCREKHTEKTQLGVRFGALGHHKHDPKCVRGGTSTISNRGKSYLPHPLPRVQYTP